MPKTPAPAAPAPDVEAPSFGTLSAYGEEFQILKAPPLLLLSEMGRTNTGDPSSVGVIADLFETTLGRDQYLRFRSLSYAADDDAAIGDAIAGVMEALAPATPTA